MRVFFVLVTALSLVGCASFKNPISMTTQYDIEAGYLTAENIAVAYRSLPLCKTGTTPSLTNVCAKRSIIVKIQQTAAKAQAAVLALRAFTKNNPTLSPLGAISVAQQALSDFQLAVSATQTP